MADATTTRRLRTFELATAMASFVVLVVAGRSDPLPDLRYVLAFGVLIVIAENRPALLPSSTSMSPSLMVVMASIPFFGDSPVIGAACVGAFIGVYVPQMRDRKFARVLFNSGQFALASAAAAVAFTAGTGETTAWSASTALHAVLAALAFGVVNIAFVVPQVALLTQQRPGTIWAEMRPAVPNYLAFGLLGLLVGQLCKELGVAAVVLLAIPVIIGRFTFMTFLRLQQSHEAAIGLFIRLIEAKDPYTAGHTERVAKYAQYIAEELGVPATRYAHLRHSALMHDVGKLAVPNRLLNKPGRLTEEEFEVIRRHNDVCVNILGRVDFMRDMAVIASDRHGRFENHPTGRRHELVREAHIVAVADAFDAMTSTRAYRRALDQDVAFDELRRNAGTQFDPDCVDALIAAVERRGERYGLGHEVDIHQYAVPPPIAGVGSAGLGDLSPAAGSS